MTKATTTIELLHNTMFNFGGKIASSLAVLILTPLIFHHLGAVQFGLWTLILLLTGCLGAFDLGFSAALTKYVAEYNITKEQYRINTLFTVALLFYLLFSVILFVFLWKLRFSLFRFFSIPELLWNKSQQILPVAVLLFLFTSIANVFQNLINGLQKMFITNSIIIFQSLLTVSLNILFLNLGYGLYGIVIATLIVLFPSLLAFVIYSKRLMPELRLAIPFSDRNFLALLRFGLTVQIARLSGIIVTQADRIIIGHFLDLTMLAYYQLGYTIISAMRGIVLLLPSAVIPFTSELCTRKDSFRLKNLYFRGFKYSAIVSFCIAGLIITLAPIITHLWLGTSNQTVVIVIQILAVGHMLHLLTSMGTSMCEGLGKPGLEAKFSIWLMVLQLCFGIISIRIFGLLGILTSTSLVIAITSVVFLIRFQKSFESGQLFSWHILILNPLSASIIASFFVLSFSKFFASRVWNYSFGHLLAFLIQVGIFMVAYSYFLFLSGYIDTFDKNIVYRLSNSIKPIRFLVKKMKN